MRLRFLLEHLGRGALVRHGVTEGPASLGELGGFCLGPAGFEVPSRHIRGRTVSIQTVFRAVGRPSGGGVWAKERSAGTVIELKGFDMEDETERNQQHL